MCQPCYGKFLLGYPVQFIGREKFLFPWLGLRFVERKGVFRNPSVCKTLVYDFTQVFHVLGRRHRTAFHVRAEEKLITCDERMVDVPDLDVRFTIRSEE